jgi:hypothetical protein
VCVQLSCYIGFSELIFALRRIPTVLDVAELLAAVILLCAENLLKYFSAVVKHLAIFGDTDAS